MPPAISNPFVAAIVFFGSERLMRDELPGLIPGGELSAVRAPRMRVRTRMLVAFLLLGSLPLAALSMAALTRADALRTADAATAAAIIHKLNLVIIVLALGGVVVSVALALLVAASLARPLSECRQPWRKCSAVGCTPCDLANGHLLAQGPAPDDTQCRHVYHSWDPRPKKVAG